MTTFSPKNELKLMILYMLKSVSFQLNHENLSNFFLDKYTTYLKFQEIVAELVDNKLIEETKTKTSVFYTTTDDGNDALESFINDIAPTHKKELDDYLKVNKLRIKEESQISSNYADNSIGGFKICLEYNENKDEIFKIEMDVPNEDAATTMCENWKTKAKAIYTHIIKQIL